MDNEKYELVVYTRNGCHLCDALIDELGQYCLNNPYTFKLIEISGDEQLENLYGTKVPVVTFKEDILCFYFLDTDLIDVYFDRGRN